MSMVNGVWYDGTREYPEDGVRVLCVKQNKAGRRDLCFGTHWMGREWDNGWITGGGCNNVIFWMPLPLVPEKEVRP